MRTSSSHVGETEYYFTLRYLYVYMNKLLFRVLINFKHNGVAY